jgi:SAM-dependent methyltransferase
MNHADHHWMNVFAMFRGTNAKFRRDERELRRQLEGRTDFPFGRRVPMLDDAGDESGIASGSYFHQDLLVARRIFELEPARHVDVGSRVDGFVAHVAVFRSIDVIDLRPQRASVRNINFVRRDIMKADASFDGITDSLSCLHAIEHFGLGRYGDAIDADGHLHAFENLARMVRPGGIMYLSAPIGPQRIEFNAHRVFHVRTLLALAEAAFDIRQFSFTDDAGDLHENVVLAGEDVASDFHCHYGCGIFEFVKRP